ncbi:MULTISPECIES: NAD(P)/FAD-dependent oxidoreductase [unclassified Dyella]|uniref:FAD-dependent oxidoreductase n=1 Tax=unclassified Dyella TaxID=2634549 RepID=UPI000CBF2D11|nr:MULTISPECIES: NAD(P)/FAD-dependent oxidoreductase [unclassified Dyella]MDR3447986.1 NAD(P)/FAD-dependent oxidoreductase [Dyella sp.]PMQ03578.1 6-hydroxynicotinate 3-monooxygenase [Dyella sp. AD56]
MRADALRVAIVGVGPGGLCLAQGLKKRGIPFDVFERDQAANSRTQGYRIRIDYTGQNALAACLPSASYSLFQRTCALPAVGVNLLDAQLKDVSGRWASAWRKTPSDADDADRCAHRQTMREVLMHGIEPHVQFGRAFSHYEEGRDSVTLHFTDGSTSDADVLVGSDGIHSAVRGQRLPGHDPIDTGSLCIYGKACPEQMRATSGAEALRGKTSIVFADGVSVIMDAMSFDPSAFESPEGGVKLTRVDDYFYWAIIGTRAAFGLADGASLSLGREDIKALVGRAAGPWAYPLRAVFECSDEGSMAIASVHSAASLPLWEAGRVTLLGDAIHAMSPAGGLGANTALRDANVLAECLADSCAGGVSVLSGIGRYEAAMRSYGTSALAASESSARALFDVSGDA